MSCFFVDRGMFPLSLENIKKKEVERGMRMYGTSLKSLDNLLHHDNTTV